ncbi:hypothetical protein [Pseudomonas viridiflava]|uniref:hypothetical protein n=1 Tax=Pseudomonas viridiflava TaxID=33069 RepID=UPI00106E9190|nr:hypothetical protein [Pseudomonas viridiflava]
MDGFIRRAIAKLRADAPEIDFTGFISDARTPAAPALEGEIWRHRRAGFAGNFSDGHWIQTSNIVGIHARGDSLWVETENGSRYGILTFAPLGWLYFSNLHRAFDQLAPTPDGTPIFDLRHMRERPEPLPSGGLNKMMEKRVKREQLQSLCKGGSGQARGPALYPDFLKKWIEDTQASVATLRRNGVKI